MKIQTYDGKTWLNFKSGLKIQYCGEPLSFKWDEKSNKWAIREGFDDEIIDSDGYCYTSYEGVIKIPSHEEMRELCDYMINEWSKFKDIFK